MIVQIYKGVVITHNPDEDKFESNLVVHLTTGKKRDEQIQAPRLGAIQNRIDEVLAASTKQPRIQKAYVVNKNWDDSPGVIQSADIILFNKLSWTVMVAMDDGINKSIRLGNDSYRNEKMYIVCKENIDTISNINKLTAQIKKLEKERRTAMENLIPLTQEHFK